MPNKKRLPDAPRPSRGTYHSALKRSGRQALSLDRRGTAHFRGGPIPELPGIAHDHRKAKMVLVGDDTSGQGVRNSAMRDSLGRNPSAGRARNRLVNNHWTPGSHGRHGLNKRWQPFTAKIAGKGLCDDARLRALAAAGGLKLEPGHRENRGQEVVRRRPLTGVGRRRRSSARHSCRVFAEQRHGPRPVDGPSRGYKSRSANVSPAKQGARAFRPPGPERGRFASYHQCGQDARAPQRKRPERRPLISERGRLARNSPTHREAP